MAGFFNFFRAFMHNRWAIIHFTGDTKFAGWLEFLLDLWWLLLFLLVVLSAIEMFLLEHWFFASRIAKKVTLQGTIPYWGWTYQLMLISWYSSIFFKYSSCKISTVPQYYLSLVHSFSKSMIWSRRCPSYSYLRFSHIRAFGSCFGFCSDAELCSLWIPSCSFNCLSSAA